jgi:hypothetical protein
MEQESGWAPELVWTQRLEEKSFCVYRGSNHDRPVVQPVTRHYIYINIKIIDIDMKRSCATEADPTGNLVSASYGTRMKSLTPNQVLAWL